jgi:hypothetical protein
MLRPEKAWAVGDKFFATYDEARTYIASRRGELQREALVAAIEEGWHHGPLPQTIADNILAKFKLTPRKP